MAMQKFTPIQYLMIDVANNFGLDQQNWDDRINWVKDHEDELEGLIKTAKEPALFFAGIQAYRAAQRGEAISYPISLDATSSGAQILSILIGCRQSASLCNVVDAGKRMDLYTSHYQEMCNMVSMPASILRKDAKQAIMTSFYGSTAMPRIIFGEGELLEAFYKVMEERTPGIWELNKALLEIWQPNAYSHDWIMPDNFHVHVKVMESISNSVDFMGHSYEIVSKVNMPTPTGLSLPANITHSIDGMVPRELSRRCQFMPSKKVEVMELILTTPDHTAERNIERSSDSRMVQILLKRAASSGFLSARILDHINEDTIHLCDANQRELIWKLLESMPGKPFNVLSVHDCFRVHPNYANDLRTQYNQVLYEISKSNLLEYIASQIIGEAVIVNKRDDISAAILEANYSLS